MTSFVHHTFEENKEIDHDSLFQAWNKSGIALEWAMKKVFSYIGEDLKTIAALRNTGRAYKHLFSSKMIGFRRDYYRKLTRKKEPVECLRQW